MTTETLMKKQEIIDLINSDNVVLIKVIHDVIYMMAEDPNKKNLLKFAGYTDDELRKVDSVVPYHFVQKIQEFYPKFKTRYFVYDYNNMPYGEFVNVMEKFTEKLIQIMHDNV